MIGILRFPGNADDVHEVSPMVSARYCASVPVKSNSQLTLWISAACK